MKEFILHLEINGGRKTQTNVSSNWLVLAPKANLLPSAVTFEYCGFMFYTSFLLNNLFCSVNAIKYYSRVLPRDAYTAGCWTSFLCVSLPSTSEWHTTEPDITQLIAQSD
jgi:hypothetical protein